MAWLRSAITTDSPTASPEVIWTIVEPTAPILTTVRCGVPSFMTVTTPLDPLCVTADTGTRMTSVACEIAILAVVEAPSARSSFGSGTVIVTG